MAQHHGHPQPDRRRLAGESGGGVAERITDQHLLGPGNVQSRGPLELRRQVEEARETGFALDLEETFDDVACVAVPTRVGGMLVGAAGVSGPSSRLPRARLEEIGRSLAARLATVERG